MALNASRAVAWSWDLSTGVVTYSQNAGELLGLPREQRMHDGLALVHPDDVGRLQTAIETAMAERGEYACDARFVRPDSKAVLWLHNRGKVECDANGVPVRIIGMAIDATEQKEAEWALTRRAREQAALFEFTDQLQRAASLREVFDSAIASIVTALACDRASILLFDAAGALQFVGWHGLSDDYRLAVAGHSPWQPSDINAAPICIPDIADADLSDALETVIANEGIRSLAFIPLIGGEKLLGKFMVYYNAPHSYGEDEVGLALTIARQLAFAVERRRAESERRQVETRLRDREEEQGRERELLQTIIDRIPVMISVYQPDTKVVRVNREFERVLGWTWQEATGVSLMEECYPDPAYRAKVAEFMESCRDGWMDVRMRRKDGRDVEASWANVRLSDRTQVGIGIDISDRKRAESALQAKEAELQTITETTPVLLVRCGRDLRYRFANRASAAMFGVTPQEVVGERIIDVMGERAFAIIQPYIERVLQGERVEYELQIPYRAAGLRWVRVIYTPEFDRDGSVSGWIASITDITQRKEAERALQDADRRKDEFLATLAHELRGPLAPLRNMLELMKRAEGDRQIMHQARDTMERQLAQMVRLVDDLLDVNRITRDRLELRPERVELSAVIRSAVETCESLVADLHHTLRLALPSQPVYLNADPVRLAQIFSNLLNNACKYTDRGGYISLDAELEDAAVIVKVRDSGVGIAPELLPNVFDIFIQADRSLERSQGGLGIGLTLVRRLVELHGGTVKAHSEGRGKGSEFVVRLPVLHTEASIAPARERSAATATTARRILVVDDNRDSASSLALLLSITGNETLTAHDGVEAVEVATRFKPDVVLLDIGLPKMNGYDACRAIRKLPGGNDVLLVAVTGWGQEDDRRKSELAGFDTHLVKPVEFAALEALLASPKVALRS